MTNKYRLNPTIMGPLWGHCDVQQKIKLAKVGYDFLPKCARKYFKK